MKKKALSTVLAAALLFSSVSGAIPVAVTAATYDTSEHIVSESDIPLRLYYDEEASHGIDTYDSVDTYFGSGSSLIEAHPNDDWERWSIPLGNGYFGANVFGRTETERIQLTEKTLANPYRIVNGSTYTDGLNNFSETYIDFGHTSSSVTDYSRELDLKTAVSTVSYKYNDVTYTREYFTSYPDKAMVIRLDASAEGALDFVLRPTVPYEQEYMVNAGDGGGKTGTVTSSVTESGVGEIVLSGALEYFGIDFVGLYKVVSDGTVTATSCTNKDGDTDGTITVSGATSAYIVITMGTDYELCSETFTSNRDNKPTQTTTLDDAMAKVQGYMDAVDTVISGKTLDSAYEALKANHLADYQELFGRVTLDLNCAEFDFELTTDQLLTNYKNGSGSTYLETLYFQYGRYLLIASSRSGALPANLQGAWNRYNHSPWSSGYWHNINVQMNYWPAFSTNIAETFEAYVEYNNAYMAKAELGATSTVGTYNKDVLDTDGGNGWSIATGGYVSDVYGSESIGNLGFTTQLFWEYFEYTQDRELLEKKVYPVLVEAARFITKMVREDADGNYIAVYSDSPEQYVNGVWYFTDKGTAYAQSFAYQNNYNLLLAAKELGISTSDTSHEDYEILETVLEQIDKYDPIRVGLSGQVKEFFEEQYYGDLGEHTHRHISQLVGLYPGNVINGTTPAWLDAAKYTLTERGDNATGWGVAHRLNLWARTQDGDRTYQLLEQLLKVNTATNLWDLHPPFQIDGNLGGTAGISEMLLQSHAGYVEPLAAIPSAWATGSYTGLVARGNFKVSATWSDGLADSFNIKSLAGGTISVKYSGIGNATVCDSDGNAIEYTVTGKDIISFETEEGKTYVIFGFEKQNKPSAVSGLTIENEMLSSSTLTWNASDDATAYKVYMARDNDPAYSLLTVTTDTSYVYTPTTNKNARITFAVTAVNASGVESDRALAYRNPSDISSSVEGVSANAVDSELQVTVKSNEYAEKFRLYSKTSDTDWTLVQESKYPIIIEESYDRNLTYGVSVLSYYGTESAITEITSVNTSAEAVTYDASNIFSGLVFKATAEGDTYKHSSTTYGDYGKLTDGNFSTSSGRFSTKAIENAVLEGEISLPTVFILDELKIYDFNGSSTSANNVGVHLKIEAFSDGEWTTVKEYSSSADILALRKSDTNGNYISVSLGGVKTHIVRVRLDSPIHNGTEQCSVSLNEIQCTGVAVCDALIYKDTDNAFNGYVFEATDPTAGGIWMPYDNITDGLTGWADERFASQKGMPADGTLDFGGSVYELHDLWVKYTGTVENNLCGEDLYIYVYRMGEWKLVAEQIYDTAVETITIDLGGVQAEKVRFVVTASRGADYYVGISEMTCTGCEVIGADVTPELVTNVLLNTTADNIIATNSTVNPNYPLTNAFDGNASTRYAINDIEGAYSLYITLNDTYLLYDMSIRAFSDSGDSAYDHARSNDTSVEVFFGGEWVTVTESFALVKGVTEISLGGVKADRIKITFNNTDSAKRATIYEIECSGFALEDSPELIGNVFADYKFAITDSSTSSNVWLPYENLTDGLLEWNDTDRFATQSGCPADGTLDFGGKVYMLGDIRVQYTGAASNSLCGQDFNLYVYRNGEWKQVVTQTYTSAVLRQRRYASPFPLRFLRERT